MNTKRKASGNALAAKVFTRVKDLQIIEQLYDGNHLEPTELERAHKLVYLLSEALKVRVR